MRALILAAGTGSRLGGRTRALPKCMVPLQGKPLIEHQLTVLRSCGIEDITLVTLRAANALKPRGLPTRLNPDFATPNMVHSLFCGSDLLEGDVLIAYGDIVYAPEVLQALLAGQERFSLTADRGWLRLWEARMDDPLGDAETFRMDALGHVLALGAKPKTLEEIEAQYTGLLLIRAEAWPDLHQLWAALAKEDPVRGAGNRKRPNLYMTDFVQRVIDSGLPVKACLVNGGWVEVDHPEDLELYESDPGRWLPWLESDGGS